MSDNILLVRYSLEQAGCVTCSSGFSIREFREGDMSVWNAIQNCTCPEYNFTDEMISKTFSGRLDKLDGRMLFLVSPEGETVGTATAWFDDFEGNECGLVHWVAVLPAFQGQGLSKPLITAVIRRFKELGYSMCFLRTQPFRVPAIELYRKFGFVPLIKTSEDVKLWEETLANFEKKGLEAGWIRTCLVDEIS